MPTCSRIPPFFVSPLPQIWPKEASPQRSATEERGRVETNAGQLGPFPPRVPVQRELPELSRPCWFPSDPRLFRIHTRFLLSIRPLGEIGGAFSGLLLDPKFQPLGSPHPPAAPFPSRAGPASLNKEIGIHFSPSSRSPSLRKEQRLAAAASRPGSTTPRALYTHLSAISGTLLLDLLICCQHAFFTRTRSFSRRINLKLLASPAAAIHSTTRAKSTCV